MIRRPPRSPLFPSTTLFRSLGLRGRRAARHLLHLVGHPGAPGGGDRKSTRLNSSHRCISYAVFCLKKYNPAAANSRAHASAAAPRGAHRPATAALHVARSGGLSIAGVRAPRGEDSSVFFFNDTATTEIYTLSLHDALPI